MLQILNLGYDFIAKICKSYTDYTLTHIIMIFLFALIDFFEKSLLAIKASIIKRNEEDITKHKRLATEVTNFQLH